MSDRGTGVGDADDAFSAYLDDELTPVERAAFEARLAADADARAEVDGIAEVRSLVRGLGAVELPAGLIDELIVAGSAEGLGGDDDAQAAPVVDLDSARQRRRGPARFAAVAGGVAAAVALVVAVVVPNQAVARPALATEVRVHQAGSAASGDPVSGLAPLTTPLRLGR